MFSQSSKGGSSVLFCPKKKKKPQKVCHFWVTDRDSGTVLYSSHSSLFDHEDSPSLTVTEYLQLPDLNQTLTIDQKCESFRTTIYVGGLHVVNPIYSC